MQNEEEFKRQIALVAPENHRNYNDAIGYLWCPWEYKRVKVERNYNEWPICSACLRPVDLEKIWI